ncbi:MAG: STAS domain-containing protein [Lachnospiraceae bacterium]|nr:STAS domain-containing protein [Lachnospiraceae bacterium]
MLDIKTVKEGNCCIVSLNGRLEADMAAKAEEKFLEAAASADEVILDCKELEYTASAGLRTLRRLQQEMKKKKGSLKLRNVKPMVADVLVLTGFAKILTLE